MSKRTSIARRPRPTTESLSLVGGERVDVLDGRTVELRDAEGRLLVRFADGAAEISAPAGDVVLRAPAGRVRIEGRGLDVSVDDTVALRARATEVVVEQASLFATRLRTTVADAVHLGERLEVRASRLFETARDVYRTATDLVQQRAGRARTIVDDTYAVRSRRTQLASTEETSIDGSKVLLG